MREFIKQIYDKMRERRRDFIWSLIGAILSAWIAFSTYQMNDVLNTVDGWLLLWLLPSGLISIMASIAFTLLTVALAVTSWITLTDPDNWKN